MISNEIIIALITSLVIASITSGFIITLSFDLENVISDINDRTEKEMNSDIKIINDRSNVKYNNDVLTVLVRNTGYNDIKTEDINILVDGVPKNKTSIDVYKSNDDRILDEGDIAKINITESGLNGEVNVSALVYTKKDSKILVI